MARDSSTLQAAPLGRVPPHNLEAEQSVLGAMMLSKTAIGEVLEILKPDDFYRGQHGQIAEVMRDLFSHGEAVDAITVAEELRRRGQIEGVGGAPYIHTLVSGIMTAANAGFYAQIVVEHATLRRLIDASTHIAQECYDVPEDIDEAINRAGEAIYKVASRRINSDFRPIRELLAESMEQLEMLASRQSDVTGVPTGFRDLDSRLSGLQKQNLIIVAARPAMGKSSFVMNIAHHVSLNENIPVVIFSLEMSQTEIVSRLICSEARVDTHRLRNGHLTDADWMRVSNAVGKLDTAPLYIDDSASISMMEIRAKCQRLKRQKELGLVVVDYIQLMTSTRRTENRVQEVSEISRGLKILAKELDVPVVAVSQLSRQTEQGGGDRRPHLSHLRECVTGDTIVCLADGRRVPIERLVGTEPEVLAMSQDGSIVQAKSDKVWRVGVRPVFRVKLASGRSIRATGKHRLYGAEGWTRVSELNVGSRVAIARRVPEQATTERWPDARVALLGQLIGDGSYLKGAPMRYTSASEDNSRLVSDAARTLASYAEILDDDVLRSATTSDLFWDMVVSIEPAGEEEVYDLTVPGPASWLADGIVSHNSGAIEQDADVVMFVFREEYYNADTPAKGEAEIIVAKHRNGPVGTEHLAFLGQYTKFADLAKQ